MRAAAAWLLVAALLGAGTLLAVPVDPNRLDWQPALAAAEPWRAWSAAFVHWSALHRAGNLTALSLVAALGVVAALPPRLALAWALAWPLTQAGLLARPDLLHYGGLSGVLHAGVALAALHLLATARGQRRAVGAALAGGLLLKLLVEAPWGPPLQPSALLGISTAPWAHASGALAALPAWVLACRPWPSSRAETNSRSS